MKFKQTKFEAKLKWNERTFMKVRAWNVVGKYFIPTPLLDPENELETTLLADLTALTL